MVLPLGKAEDNRLDFKPAHILGTPGIVSRNVAAMLNASGGEIWIGLRDERSHVVAVEGVPEAEREVKALRDYLMDTIEPSPIAGEIEVESRKWGDSEVLRIVVSPQGNGPYAYLENGGRFFLIREGSHIRLMRRDEIFGTVEEGTEVSAAIRRVLEEEGEVREQIQTDEKELFWLHLLPSRDLKLDLEEIERGEILLDPVASGNRREGFVALAGMAGFGPRLLRDDSGAAHLEVGQEGGRSLRIFPDGGLSFTIPLASFRWRSPFREDPATMLWPDAVLEYPVSVFRLASAIYKSAPVDRDVWRDSALVAHMAAFNLKGWFLRPDSPRRWTFQPPAPVPFSLGEDFVLEKPLVFPSKDLDQPDACGFRLILRIYEAFGLTRSQIPPEFDQKEGRLVIPG